MCSPHPHLQIRHRRPDVALGPFRDLAGDGDGSAPAAGEEGRENLVFRGLDPDRLEPGLEALGQAGHIEVGGAEERMAGSPHYQRLTNALKRLFVAKSIGKSTGFYPKPAARPFQPAARCRIRHDLTSGNRRQVVTL